MELDGLLVPALKVRCHSPSTIFDCRWKIYTVLPYLRVGDQYVLRASRFLTFSYSAGIKGSRRTQSGNVAIKYCSDRYRHNKPGPVDRKIENAFLALLEDEKVGPANSDADAIKAQRKPGRNLAKRDRRILLQCGTVGELFFVPRHDPGKKCIGVRKAEQVEPSPPMMESGRAWTWKIQMEV
jgi:hypothetical protein